MSRRLDELFSKKLQKSLISQQRTRNRRFSPNLQPFRAKIHVSAFGSTFHQKLQNVPHFAKKQEKWSIWPKCKTFSRKEPCFGVWVNFSAKTCKKCLISRRSMKNRQKSAKMCNFFEQTTIFRRFGELLSKKFQTVPNFAKKHKKSSIWQKLASFTSKPPCIGVWVNVLAKKCKKSPISQKSMKNRRFSQTVEVF